MTVLENEGASSLVTTARVVVFGDVFDDVIVRPQAAIRTDTDTLASIERRPGGSAANTAAWLGSLKTPVDFVGRTNLTDTLRHENALRDSGVTPHLSGESSLPTGTIVVIVDSATDTRTMLTERGANVHTSPDDVTEALLDGASHLHFTGYTVFSGQPIEGFGALIERARMHGVTVSVDPGSSGFLADHGAEEFLCAVRGADILFPNLDEGVALTGLTEPTAIVSALNRYFPVVALTLGRAGALVGAVGAGAAPDDRSADRRVDHGADRTASRSVFISADCVPVEPLDTTGAGDAFNAGFLAGVFDGLNAGDHPLRLETTELTARLTRAAHQGVATASRAIESVGARPPGVVSHHGSAVKHPLG